MDIIILRIAAPLRQQTYSVIKYKQFQIRACAYHAYLLFGVRALGAETWNMVLHMEAGYGHFVCSFWRLMEGHKTNKRQNEISFLRFGDLYNATKRQNEMAAKLHFVALSFVRFVDFHRAPKRQNDNATK